MRLLTSFLLLIAPAFAQPGGFAVFGSDPGAWPQILSSIGLHSAPAADAAIVVARPGTAATPGWPGRLDTGTFLILEGDSPLAESFGFHVTSDTTHLAVLQDVHLPKLPLIFEKPIEIAKTNVPGGARVFARERWTGAPALAGFRRGRGGVLWLAVNPGAQGYERFPYLPQALADLGFEPPFRGNRTWAFFDYSYRARVDLDYFAARWRAAGISALHVAAWHFYDADAVRDAYLRRLIEACHREGILVYAWLELPHVSEKFWNDHPAWREKTAVLQDAQLDWRKLMNLANPECLHAVKTGVKDLISRFDWDGVNLAELYYESLEGASNPARFTPMNDDVRAAFRLSPQGFDPIELWRSRTDAKSQRQFLDYRATLARNLQEDWLREAASYRAARPDLDIVLTHVDDRFDTGMRDAIGADTSRLLPLLESRDFTFLIEDPATVWNLGPKRYPEIAKRYPASSKLAIDINVVDRYQDVYPTKQQTGTELYELVHLASGAFPRVALYFENSLLPPDLALLPAASAVTSHVERIGTKLAIDSAYGVGVRWPGGASVDGHVWPVGDGQTIWLPAGAHTIESTLQVPIVRMTAFNGTLQSASVHGSGRLEFTYESSSRALATLEEPPQKLEVDGRPYPIRLTGLTLQLPRGRHTVVCVL